MSQKKSLRVVTNAERALWSNAMSGVKQKNPQPKKHDRSRFDQSQFDAPIVKRHRGANSQLRPRATAQNSPSSEDLPDLQIGTNGGTDRRTADRLRRGRLAIDLRLDLHGLTLEMAHRRLLGFLNAAQSAGARCVLVVTGKGIRTQDGRERLQKAVPRWLNEPTFRSMVLSVAHARPRDGGDGALYILMRKLRTRES